MKNKLKFKNNEYELIFDSISVSQSIEINNNSYVGGQFSSMAEMNAVFKKIDLVIKKNGIIVFYEDLSFSEAFFLYEFIKSELHIQEEEINTIRRECLNRKNQQEMFEIILAKNILGGLVQLSALDFKNMNIKEYERLIIAIETLKEQK